MLSSIWWTDSLTVQLGSKKPTVWNVSKYRVLSSPYFPAFRLNMKRYFVSLRIQSEDGKIRTRKTPYLDTFHAVNPIEKSLNLQLNSYYYFSMTFWSDLVLGSSGNLVIRSFSMKPIIRSSHREVFLRKGVLKICSKFTAEHPCWKSYFGMGILL